MVGDKSKHEARILESKFDQDCPQALPFEVVVFDVEVPGVGILAGDDFVLERRIKGKLPDLEIVMREPGKDRYKQAKEENRGEQIEGSAFPAQQKNDDQENQRQHQHGLCA